MTVEKILILTDSQTPNELSEEVKIGWICDVEGRILTEIYKRDADKLSLPRKGSDILTLPDAYAKIYLLYISAMVEFSKGNYGAFSQINAEFERNLAIFARYYIRQRR